MNENENNPGQEKLNAWIKTQLDGAVSKLTDQGRVNSLLIEAKPAWVLPFQILIGKIRAQGDPSKFDWFICGDFPTDFLESTVASTPRDAARHFSMKWQLQVARQQAMDNQPPLGPDLDPDEIDTQLAEKAEALYGLVENTGLWQQESSF
jgi:hypothetical protein